MSADGGRIMHGELFAADLPVHPVAALFAMMADEDLADLAADIKANGQRFPIMLDAAGELLVDGRNRRAACKLVGIDPTVARLAEGQNPVAYIWSVNVSRRHMSKGQIAMTAARVRSVSDQTQRQAAKLSGVGQTRLANAEVVLEFAPDLVPGILAGSEFLDAAYKVAQDRKAAAMSTEARAARLRQAAPDVADLVTEQRLSLEAGEAEVIQRREQAQQVIRTGRTAAEELARVGSRVSDLAAPTEFGAHLVTQELVDGVAAAARRLAEMLLEKEAADAEASAVS